MVHHSGAGTDIASAVAGVEGAINWWPQLRRDRGESARCAMGTGVITVFTPLCTCASCGVAFQTYKLVTSPTAK